ncbi:MAG: UDP-glucose 6-dehydrogenase 1 [Candelina mexicana]|nr:MAG: UDP-glucose 6-dehydrogenase 1 [Candelina mexicana]
MVHRRGHLRSGSAPVLDSAKQFSPDRSSLVSHEITPSADDLTMRPSALHVPHKLIKRICCIGAGYVGGPSASVIAFKTDIEVTVVDFNSHRIAAWNSDALPIYEPDLLSIVLAVRNGTTSAQNPPEGTEATNGSLIQHNVVKMPNSVKDIEPSRTEGARRPNLFFSTNVKQAIIDADLIFICVNTPTKTKGIGKGQAADLEYLEAATRTIAKVATESKIVVEKSSVPCRTAQHVRDILVANARPGVHFDVLSNPEFLAEGTAIADLLHPDRILIGSLSTASGHRAAASLSDVYAQWVPKNRIITMNLWSAELSKLAANAMLAQRISSVNALSAICEATGASVDEVAYACGLDSRIGPHMLKASPGFGGSCFRKDILSLVYLSESLHLKEVAEYWRSVLTINDYQKQRFTKRIISSLHNSLASKKIAVLGFAFKKDTGDARESAAITLVTNFVAEDASVSIYDPLVEEHQIWYELGREHGDLEVLKRNVAVCRTPYEACAKADAVVVMTEWEEFSNKFNVTTTPTTRSTFPLGKLDPNHTTTPKPSGSAPSEVSKMGQRSSGFECNCIPPSQGLPTYLFEREHSEVVPISAQGTDQRAPVSGQSKCEPSRSSPSRRNKPAALDLGMATITEIDSPLPIAAIQPLRSPRFTNQIKDVTYPGSVSSPNPALNATAPTKKFKYETKFLLEFKEVFTEKPGPDWDLKMQEIFSDRGHKDVFTVIDRARAGHNIGGHGQSNERLDWARIAKGMKKPMYVFDGRNILDARELENLGFKVEAIGKAGEDFMRGREFE